MKKIKQFIIEFVQKLNRTQKLIASVILLVVMIILVNLISNVSFKETFIDYKNVTARTLIETSTVSTDRDTYLKLNEIVTNFLNTNIGMYSIDNKKVDLKDYYTYTLFEEYKYNMSYGKFKKIATNFYSKVFSNENEKYTNIPLDNVINTVYLFSEPRNMYIVQLNTNVIESPYIGIELDDYNGKYSIFFIE